MPMARLIKSPIKLDSIADVSSYIGPGTSTPSNNPLGKMKLETTAMASIGETNARRITNLERSTRSRKLAEGVSADIGVYRVIPRSRSSSNCHKIAAISPSTTPVMCSGRQRRSNASTALI
jgi:hypothetical protein